jgi:hypothetical protein
MKRFVALFAVLALAGFAAANAAEPLTLGPGKGIAGLGTGDQCTGTLYYNHDGTFENGYAWSATYIPGTNWDGAFAEAFVLTAPQSINCVDIWLATLAGLYGGQPMDVYVWEDGIAGPPGAVIGMNLGYVLPYAPVVWAGAGTYDPYEIEMGCIPVTADFTVGYCGEFENNYGYFILSDQNGFMGYPWTYVPGGGWDDPNVISSWVPCISLGFGVWLDAGPSPVESVTWGSIKALFE